MSTCGRSSRCQWSSMYLNWLVISKFSHDASLKTGQPVYFSKMHKCVIIHGQIIWLSLEKMLLRSRKYNEDVLKVSLANSRFKISLNQDYARLQVFEGTMKEKKICFLIITAFDIRVKCFWKKLFYVVWRFIRLRTSYTNIINIMLLLLM